MITERVRSGIRKDASFEENLGAVKENIEEYGVLNVLDKLERMLEAFQWVLDSEEAQLQIRKIMETVSTEYPEGEIWGLLY